MSNLHQEGQEEAHLAGLRLFLWKEPEAEAAVPSDKVLFLFNTCSAGDPSRRGRLREQVVPVDFELLFPGTVYDKAYEAVLEADCVPFGPASSLARQVGDYILSCFRFRAPRSLGASDQTRLVLVADVDLKGCDDDYDDDHDDDDHNDVPYENGDLGLSLPPPRGSWGISCGTSASGNPTSSDAAGGLETETSLTEGYASFDIAANGSLVVTDVGGLATTTSNQRVDDNGGATDCVEASSSDNEGEFNAVLDVLRSWYDLPAGEERELHAGREWLAMVRPPLLETERGGGQERCCICLEDSESEEKLTLAKLARCGHVFHRACLFKWLPAKHHCPYCRTTSVADVYKAFW